MTRTPTQQKEREQLAHAIGEWLPSVCSQCQWAMALDLLMIEIARCVLRRDDQSPDEWRCIEQRLSMGCPHL